MHTGLEIIHWGMAKMYFTIVLEGLGSAYYIKYNYAPCDYDIRKYWLR